MQPSKILGNKHVFSFLFILFCLSIFYFVRFNKKENYKNLLDNGIKAKAIIYTTELNLANRGTIYKYQFIVDGKTFSGDIYLKKINSQFDINDTIEILYLKNKPSKNISQYDFSKLYN